MSNLIEFTEIFMVLAAAYPRFVPGNQTIEVYYELLKDLDTNLLKNAALQCANSGEWFPSVHELRAAAADLVRQQNQIPSAYEAWEEVYNHPRDNILSELRIEDGRYYIDHREVHWSHPIVENVARQLGWPNFPGAEDDIVGDRAHFFKAYAYAIDKAVRDFAMLPQVRNYIESHQAAQLPAMITGLAERMRVK